MFGLSRSLNRFRFWRTFSVSQTLVYWVVRGISGAVVSCISLLWSISCKSEPAECQEDFKNTSWWCVLASRRTKTAPQATRPNKGSNNVRCRAGSAVRLRTDYVHTVNRPTVQFRLRPHGCYSWASSSISTFTAATRKRHQGGRQSLIQSGMTAFRPRPSPEKKKKEANMQHRNLEV